MGHRATALPGAVTPRDSVAAVRDEAFVFRPTALERDSRKLARPQSSGKSFAFLICYVRKGALQGPDSFHVPSSRLREFIKYAEADG